MNEINDNDEGILPGFRFHPTDEELVGFYLKSKIQQKALPIELIPQLDIYKYNPWDLPKLSTTGEKEWYFYCPRDRKYKNSTRPNRVTGAGFWKATGTDRPIYSAVGTKCIGLKKSLVFYKGRASRGIKTDWMMHEFRLPSADDSSLPRRPLEKKIISANELLVICKIFKKANSMAQRHLSHPWASQLPETMNSDTSTYSPGLQYPQCVSRNFAAGGTTSCSETLIEFGRNDASHQPTNLSSSSRPPPVAISSREVAADFTFSSQGETSVMPLKSPDDMSSMFINFSPAMLGGGIEKCCPSIDFGRQHQNNSDPAMWQMESTGNFSDSWLPSLSWDTTPPQSERF